jgi:O-methyltransferase involved in polyketide biosynthesis
MSLGAINFPLCLRNFFGEFFQPVLVAGIEAVPALGAGICSRAMRRDLWSSFYSRREET